MNPSIKQINPINQFNSKKSINLINQTNHWDVQRETQNHEEAWRVSPCTCCLSRPQIQQPPSVISLTSATPCGHKPTYQWSPSWANACGWKMECIKSRLSDGTVSRQGNMFESVFCSPSMILSPAFLLKWDMAAERSSSSSASSSPLDEEALAFFPPGLDNCFSSHFWCTAYQ